MERKKNGYFKAISIISLVFAIIFSVVSILLAYALVVDFETFSLSLTGELAGIGYIDMTDLETMNIQTYVIGLLISFVVYQVFFYVAYARFRKYKELTNEEASNYNARIIAWIVIMFVFAGILCGSLTLIGYLTITRNQIDEYRGTNINSEQEIRENNAESSQIITENIDKMIERLEKLQKIKDMGGLTDKEYEDLRNEIINNRE